MLRGYCKYKTSQSKSDAKTDFETALSLPNSGKYPKKSKVLQYESFNSTNILNFEFSLISISDLSAVDKALIYYRIADIVTSEPYISSVSADSQKRELQTAKSFAFKALNAITAKSAPTSLEQSNKPSKSNIIILQSSLPLAIIWQQIGVICWQLGEIEEAEEAVSYANTLDPRSSQNWWLLAEIYMKQVRLAEAGQSIQRAMKLIPEEVGAQQQILTIL